MPAWLTIRENHQPPRTYRYDSEAEARDAGPRIAAGIPRGRGYVALLLADPAVEPSDPAETWDR